MPHPIPDADDRGPSKVPMRRKNDTDPGRPVRTPEAYPPPPPVEPLPIGYGEPDNYCDCCGRRCRGHYCGKC